LSNLQDGSQGGQVSSSLFSIGKSFLSSSNPEYSFLVREGIDSYRVFPAPARNSLSSNILFISPEIPLTYKELSNLIKLALWILIKFSSPSL